MRWIDAIVKDIGTNDVYDALSLFDINLLTVEHNNPNLQGNEATLQIFGDFKIIYVSDEVVNKNFAVAHELGHYLLHDYVTPHYFNKSYPKGRLEQEANYFAAKLLYSDLEIEDGIETYKHLADSLGVSEEIAEYIVDNKKF